jgi:opacity protein-like surface antigen
MKKVSVSILLPVGAAHLPIHVLLVVLGVSSAFTLANADDALGIYVGAGFGQSHLRSEKEIQGDADFDYLLEGHHSAWYVAAGIRPIRPLGVELEYIDFGKLHSGNYTGLGSLTAVDAKAGTLSALGYLPLPVPFLDIYGKVGVARLHETTSEIGPILFCPVEVIPCSPRTFDISNWNTALAYGAGVQGKIGSLAIRAEYERIGASGENPSIASLGVTWAF